jgi:formate hydrogenlyase transcriptional activator
VRYSPLLIRKFLGRNHNRLSDTKLSAIELENFIERAVILTQGSELYVPITELKKQLRAARTNTMSKFHDAERQAIIDALKAAEGRLAGIGRAAERPSLKRTTLQNKMRRLQVARSEYCA